MTQAQTGLPLGAKMCKAFATLSGGQSNPSYKTTLPGTAAGSVAHLTAPIVRRDIALFSKRETLVMSCVDDSDESGRSLIAHCICSSHHRAAREETGREIVDPVTWRRSSWYDDFAHEVSNNMANVFSRTSSVNHEALILHLIQCDDDLGQQKWLTH
jgi:hypothetical protein